MNATEKQYVEKLKDIKESFSNLSNRYYMWSSMAVIYKQDLDPLIAILESEISALESQSEEESYPREFVEWLIIDPPVLYNGRYYLISEAEEWNIDEVFEYWQSKVKP